MVPWFSTQYVYDLLGYCMVFRCLGYAIVLGAERTSCTASQSPGEEGGFCMRCSQRWANTWEGTSPLATRREEERGRRGEGGGNGRV